MQTIIAFLKKLIFIAMYFPYKVEKSKAESRGKLLEYLNPDQLQTHLSYCNGVVKDSILIKFLDYESMEALLEQESFTYQDLHELIHKLSLSNEDSYRNMVPISILTTYGIR